LRLLSVVGRGLDGGADGGVEVAGADQLDDAGVLQPLAKNSRSSRR
jgi:hypothetical protein